MISNEDPPASLFPFIISVQADKGRLDRAISKAIDTMKSEDRDNFHALARGLAVILGHVLDNLECPDDVSEFLRSKMAQWGLDA